MNGALPSNSIAVIGMAGRFPGARSIGEFLENLRAGKESITFFSNEELIEVGIDPDILRQETTVKARGVLHDVELFDAGFFSVGERDAELTDPQQRIFLECAYEAIEDAGHGADANRNVGVFAGVGINSYLLNNIISNSDRLRHVSSTQFRTLNRSDNLAPRVSYKLDLRGPSISVQTNCSTSLVAVHLACQSLLLGECRLAIAGGVAVYVPQQMIQTYQEGGIASKDGHCRAFDADASGMVSGNGSAVVVLRRLEEAVAERDNIYAVIRGTAVNNDGAVKAGYTAPGVQGQVAVITQALDVAGVDAGTIEYVEAHGTGTPLGDPAEITALTHAYRRTSNRSGYCAIGSVKTNIGHLDTAAGAAGLIKAILSLRHRQIFPSLHFTKPNPEIAFADTPFFVCDRLVDWKNGASPRRAAVSSFGIGGTNAHAILEEAPEPYACSTPRSVQLLVLSAKSKTALEKASRNLAEFLRKDDSPPLAGIAFTAAIGRKAFEYRRAIVTAGKAPAAALLTASGHEFTAAGAPIPIAFSFGGQGTQRPNMGLEIYNSEPLFRKVVDQCAETLIPLIGRDVRSILFRESANGQSAELDETLIAQPALFVIQYALARTLQDWGIQPATMAGHSVGEYVAACLAGVFDLESALAIVAIRARLVSSLPRGAMLAIALSEADLRASLPPDLSVAAVNGPSRCIVSGEFSLIERLEQELLARNIGLKRLRVSHAFHSGMMKPIAAQLRDAVADHSPGIPHIPFVSNVTGTWIQDQQAADPGYWTEHLLSTVRWQDSLNCLGSAENLVIADLSPAPGFSALSRTNAMRSGKSAFAAMPQTSAESEVSSLLRLVGNLWAMGTPVSWDRFYSGRNLSRVPIPTYPFEKKPFWIRAVPEKQKAVPVAPASLDVFPPGAPEHQEQNRAAQSESPPRSSCAAPGKRADVVRMSLSEGMFNSFGLRLDESMMARSFLELGLDSLALMQLSQFLKARFNVTVTFRQLLEEFGTIGALLSHLEAETETGVVIAEPASSSPLLDRLDALASEIAAIRIQLGQSPPQPAITTVRRPRSQALDGSPDPASSEARTFGPWRPVAVAHSNPLSSSQRRFIEELGMRLMRRTTNSKALAQRYRRQLADPRSNAGFHPNWKEMVYPIAAAESSGAHIRDIDGNDYVDLVMGFGVNLFGHNPRFVTEAIGHQLSRGMHIGVQTGLAGQVAELICGFAGAERVVFCNTGSEAVMCALRIARAVSSRSKIVMFAGSYHGIFDGVLCRPGADMASIPIAPGVSKSAVTDTWILEYGSDESLKIIREHIQEIAAVLVEPVQSSRLDFQPSQFLNELRTVTLNGGAALIFDEMITGFRIHPGGCQAWFGVQADLILYGKVVGGGLPIGVIAGKSAYLDAVDGGAWSYGDDSYPAVNQTFMAGTFSRHPLTLVAAQAVLEHLKSAGPALQSDLNRRTASVVSALNSSFHALGAPLETKSFGSLFRFHPAESLPSAGLLYFHLLAGGVHLWEGRTCFLSTAHSDSDLERVVDAVRAAVQDMQAAGYLPIRSRISRPLDAEKPGPLPEQKSGTRSLPVTDAQRGVWIACQNSKYALAYNESVVIEVRGALNRAALMRAVGSVVNRHEALRSAFTAMGDRQIVHAEVASDLAVVSLPSIDGAGTRDEAFALLRQRANTPFDLENGPLIRFCLLALGPDLHLFNMLFHHLIADNWSVGIILQEILAIYEQERTGIRALLPQPVPFSAYAEFLEREKNNPAAREFWTGQMSGSLPALDVERTKTAFETCHEATVKCRCNLDRCLTEKIRDSARKHGATLFMHLLAAYQVFAHRLFGSPDLVVGVPAAGQSAMGSVCLVGYCLQLLPIRSRYEDTLRWDEFLAATREVLLGAFKHQSYSVATLVAELAREGSDPIALPTIFNIDGPARRLATPGLDLHSLPPPGTGVKAKVLVNVSDSEDGMVVDFECDASIWDRETLERRSDSYRSLLEQLVADATQRVAALKILGESEQQMVLYAWNRTDHEYPAEPLQQAFESWAAETPAATALEFNGTLMSYAELDRRANQLANYLCKLGVQPEIRVGVCMERSFEMAIAILAIIKAGGTYVPLDPEYPSERLAYITADAQTSIILTQERLRASLAAVSAAVLCVDSDTDNIKGRLSREPVTRPYCTSAPSSPIYIIYTSGSAGHPKGVVNTHGGLVNRLEWMQQVCRLRPESRVLQKTPFSFDVSVWEIFLPLRNGARLVIAPPGAHRDPSALAEVIRSSRSTVLHFVPSMLKVFLAAGVMKQCTSLEQVFCSGEVLSIDLQREFFRQSAAALYNLYGPTEAAVDVSWWRCSQSCKAPSVPIGAPIANIQLYVLDGNFEPRPIGVIGELFIAGVGLASGYVNRPDLTAERFVPNPYGPPGTRLYRTGDSARWLPGGNIEYVGRLDRQVKIRGTRVELGEIEATLESHPSVAQAVVIAKPSANGELQLVAHVSGNGGGLVSREALWRWASQRLPDVMMPSRLVVHAELPLNATGKLDRNAIAALATASTEHFETHREPAMTELQRRIAGIWREILEQPVTDVNASFFELGGHSLSAIQMLIKVRDVFGVEVSLRAFFDAPAIAALADHISSAAPTPSAAVIAPAPFRRARKSGRSQTLAAAHSKGEVLGSAGDMPDLPAAK
jgi:amino acid adenylation domain-containing protein